MARLAVRAEAEDTLASPGNSEPCYVALSITTGAGEPVSGLSAADFRSRQLCSRREALSSEFPR